MSYKLYAVAASLMIAGTAAAAGTQQVKRVEVVPTSLQCTDEAQQAEAARLLAAAISARVAALPAERRSAEDIEAAIVFEISQRNLCPGVARTALASLSGGTGSFALAVSRVSSTLLPGGTAGIRPGGNTSGSGNSFFSAPVVGLGGGSANYSQ